MSPTVATFLLEAVNFLLLAGLLGYFFFRPVREALERKRAEAEKQAAEAAQSLAEAERLRDETRKERASLEAELETRRREAMTKAESEAEAVLTRAREVAEKERESARAALANLSDAELSRLADAVADAVAQSVGQLLSRLSSGELDRELVRVACRELHALGKDGLGKVVVETAHPLDGETRRKVEDSLGSAAPEAEFRVLPEVGAGIRITTGRGLVDASAAGLADFARRSLAAALGQTKEDTA